MTANNSLEADASRIRGLKELMEATLDHNGDLLLQELFAAPTDVSVQVTVAGYALLNPHGVGLQAIPARRAPVSRPWPVLRDPEGKLHQVLQVHNPGRLELNHRVRLHQALRHLDRT